MPLDAFFKKTIINLFHLLLIVTPLLWTAKMSELFEFPKMLFVYGVTVMIVTAWIARMIIAKKVLIQKTFFDLPLLLFFISQLLSTLISIDPHTSLFGYYSRFHGGLLSTIAYIALFYAFVSNISPKGTRKLIKSTLIGATIASLYAFPEHFGFSPSCQVIGAGFKADCWVQDVVTRVFGTFGQPNWLAAYLIALIFIPLSKIFELISASSRIANRKSRIELVLPLLMFILFFSVLLFTKSRSGLMGFGIGLVIFSFGTLFLIKSKKVVHSLLAVYAILATIYLAYGRGIIPQFDSLFHTRNSSSVTASPAPQVGTVLDTGGTESGDIRKIVWQGAIEVFKKYPILGSGVETFAYSYYNVRPQAHNLTSEWDFLYNKAHNEWLNFLANSGALGLGAYLFLMFSFVLYMLKSCVDNRESSDVSLLLALLSGYSALAVSNFFGFSTVSVALLFFLFPAFAISLKFDDRNTKHDNRESKIVNRKTLVPPLTAGQNSAIFLLLLLGSYFVYSVYKLYAADRAYVSGLAYADKNQLQTALSELEVAIKLLPSEPLYKDEFAKTAGSAALYLYEQKQATAGAKVADLAIEISDQTIAQNRVHLNFYKTRTRLLANLGIFNPRLLDASIETLKTALTLAPTDAKLYHSLGMIYLQKQNYSTAQNYFEKAIEQKTDYELARFTLGELFESQKQYREAKEQFDYIITHIAPGNLKAKARSEALQKMVK